VPFSDRTLRPRAPRILDPGPMLLSGALPGSWLSGPHSSLSVMNLLDSDASAVDRIECCSHFQPIVAFVDVTPFTPVSRRQEVVDEATVVHGVTRDADGGLSVDQRHVDKRLRRYRCSRRDRSCPLSVSTPALNAFGSGFAVIRRTAPDMDPARTGYPEDRSKLRCRSMS